MTWQEFALACQVLTEERVGVLVRQRRDQEDAEAERLKTNIERLERT